MLSQHIAASNRMLVTVRHVSMSNVCQGFGRRVVYHTYNKSGWLSGSSGITSYELGAHGSKDEMKITVGSDWLVDLPVVSYVQWLVSNY